MVFSAINYSKPFHTSSEISSHCWQSLNEVISIRKLPSIHSSMTCVYFVQKSRYFPIMWTWWNVHVTSPDERLKYENYFKVGWVARETLEGILTWTSNDYWQNDTRSRTMWQISFCLDRHLLEAERKPQHIKRTMFYQGNVWTHRSQGFGIERRRIKWRNDASSSSQSSKCFLLSWSEAKGEKEKDRGRGSDCIKLPKLLPRLPEILRLKI